jgi:transcriptional regulator with XRE-family HTH domain
MSGTKTPPAVDVRRSGLAGQGDGLPAKLRALRLERDLTLADVAHGAKISASFLSLVETGKCDITIGRLTRLVQFYGVPIGDLLSQPKPDDPEVIRKKERPRLRSAEGIEIFLLSPDLASGLISMEVRFEPGAGREDPGRHAGDEFVHVLEGKLFLELEGSEPRELCAGDSAYYSGSRPHLMRNASKSEVLRLICVDTSRLL